MVESNLNVLEKDILRHEQQIHDLNERLNELSTSHQETGFILKTYMENMKTFGDKIDKLTNTVEELMPGKKDWEFEKRLEVVESKQINLNKYKLWTMAAVVLLLISIISPDALPHLIHFYQQMKP